MIKPKLAMRFEPHWPKPGLYQHYKGPFYRVIAVAHHSETQEAMVVYQALYGDKGQWVRPLSMFEELVKLENGTQTPRFRYYEHQSIVMEVAQLPVCAGDRPAFLDAFSEAQQLIFRQSGFIDLQLLPNTEADNGFLLTVLWQQQSDHALGFRQSADYQRWCSLLHPFYPSKPEVTYYTL